MSITHVFLLYHTSGSRFLLGQAADVRAHLRAYSPSAFDLGRSRFFATPDVATAMQLVSTLQHAFACSHEPNHHNSPGRSWMQTACWMRMLSFLEHVKDLMPHEGVRHPLQVLDAQEQQVRRLWPEEKLKQVHEQHERSKQSAEVEAERTGQVLAKLIEHSSFVAVVRTLKGYVLVGQAANGYEAYIGEALDRLMSASSGIDEYDQWGDADDEEPCYYAAEIGYRPGQSESNIDTFFGWCEHLVWTQQEGIPGLDATLGWQEAKRAAMLLTKAPRTYLAAPAVSHHA